MEIVNNLVVICDCNLVETVKLDELKDLLRLKVKLSVREVGYL